MSKPSSFALFVHPDIEVRSCEWGFGVFAKNKIPADTILEECHYIRFKSSDNKSPVINDYVFRMANPEDDPEESKYNGLVLGFGSIYNHSDNNNAAYYMDTAKNVYVYHSIREIAADEQICISYGPEWWTSRERSPSGD